MVNVDEENDMLCLSAREQLDRSGTCCAQLDDFDWIVPPYDPDTLFSGRDRAEEVADIDEDVRTLPDVFTGER